MWGRGSGARRSLLTSSLAVLTEENVQRYAKGLYPIGFLLLTVPLVDVALRAMPPQFGTLQWRFATVGLALGNMGTMVLGAGLLGLVAAIRENRKFLRVLGFAALVVAAILLAVVVLFALDALQMRGLVQPALKRQVLLSSAGAAFTASFGILAFALLGRAALGASRPARSAATRRSAAGSPLVVATTPVASPGEAV